MTSKLLELVALDTSIWEKVINSAENKHISKSRLRLWIDPKVRANVISMLENEQIQFEAPRLVKIPKPDSDKMRELIIECEDARVLFAVINNALFKLFPDMIHKNCVSYQEGIGIHKIIKDLSSRVVNSKSNLIGIKVDFHSYFESISRECLFKFLDKIEDRLGFDRGTEPIINLIRRTYSEDELIYKDEVISEYKGIRQGNPLSTFFANAILYDIDNYMSFKYDYYKRYSDDCIILASNPSAALSDLKGLLSVYGVTLNKDKTELIYRDKYFKFLGFNIKGSNITISKHRLMKFEHEIKMRTISNYKITYKNALKSVMNFLYGNPKSNTEYSWGTSILRTVNVLDDLNEMNKFVMDCLRAVNTNRRHLMGLGYEPNKLMKNKETGETYSRLGVVTYSPSSGGRGGPNVKSNIELVGKEIKGYITLVNARDLLMKSPELLNVVRSAKHEDYEIKLSTSSK